MSEEKYISRLSYDGTSIYPRREDIKDVGRYVEIGYRLHLCQMLVNKKWMKFLCKGCKDIIPAIIDEMKPYFGLSKVGCHTFRWKGRLHISYPYSIHKEGYSTLAEISQEIRSDKHLLPQIQKIIAFREIFGISTTYEKNILVNSEKGEVISFIESGSVVVNDDVGATTLSNTIISKWRITPEIIRETLYYPVGKEEPSDFYRRTIESVVMRINRDMIWLVDLFLDRISTFLPY